MKIPSPPPDYLALLNDEEASGKVLDLFVKGTGPAPEGKYRHWETLKRLRPPQGYSSEEWWAAIKLSRRQTRRELPMMDSSGILFHYTMPDPMLQMLHRIDRMASGAISLPEPVTNAETRDRYVQSTLIEEAVTSSQLEGAVATRQEAREMIRSGRSPLNKSELMILNNYRAMEVIRERRSVPLSPSMVTDIHRVVSEGTLPDGEGPFRSEGDGIGVYDNTNNTLLHKPPHASEIENRLKVMCAFANESEPNAFLHPVVKAIILHFWLAYDHPFVDGNGRTARALFYWMMLRQGFWLVEYISISSILKNAPAKYGRSFLYTETDENDLTYFILAQLQVICRSIDSLYEYLGRKAKEMREVTALMRASVELNSRQAALLGHALRHSDQRYTFESHKVSHRITYQTARTDLLDLHERGLLIQRKVGRTFVFTPAPNLADRLRALK